MPDPMQIDWSKVGSTPTQPAIPQIDWSRVTPPQPIAPIPTQSAIPQIDWTKVNSAPQPIAPIPSAGGPLSVTLGANPSKIGTNIDWLGSPGMDIQLESRQYKAPQPLSEPSQMPTKYGARTEDIYLPTDAPAIGPPKTLGQIAREVAGRVSGTGGKAPETLNQALIPKVGEAVTELAGKPAAKAWYDSGASKVWDEFNKPRLQDVEDAPGLFLEKHLPFGGPWAKDVADFGMANTTSIAGALTLGGATALRTMLGAGGKIANYYNKANKIAKLEPIIGPLTKAEALDPATLGYKLLTHIDEAKLTRTQQTRLYRQELTRRLRDWHAVNETGREGFFARTAQLFGDLPKENFKPILGKFNDAELDAMHQIIKDNKILTDLDKTSAGHGLERMLGKTIGGVPEMSELKFLDKVFPGIGKIKQPGQGILHGVGEFGGAARALESSFDFSFPGRQGAWTASRPQYWGSWKPALKAIDDAEYAKHIDDLPRNFKHYDLAQMVKLDVTDARNIFNAEDEFSSMISKLPGIRHSSQGYSAFANTLRQSMFDDLIETAKLQGRDPYKDKKLATDLANYINSATGRGKLSDRFQDHAYTLNQLLYSPRLAASRIDLIKRATWDVAKTGVSSLYGGVDLKRLGNLPFASKATSDKIAAQIGKLNVPSKKLNVGGLTVKIPGIKAGVLPGLKNTQFRKAARNIGIKEYAQVDPFVRRQFWRDFLGYAATQSATMIPFKAAQMFGADVEFSMDPRNPDFGKAKMGNIRFDSNGGFQPYIRAFSQIMQKSKVSSVSGKVTKLGEGYRAETDLDVLTNAIMAKASPLASFGLNFLRGETITGEPTSLVSELQNKLTPIFAQDIVSVLKENPKMAPLLIPTFFGTGLQVYGPRDIKRQTKKSPYAVTVSPPKIKPFKLTP